MQVEYRKHLVEEYGEDATISFELRRWKVDPIKDWESLISHLKEELETYT